MAADSIEELELSARRMGLKSSWRHDGNIIHYDLNSHYRGRAIALGAKEVTTKELIRKVKNNS